MSEEKKIPLPPLPPPFGEEPDVSLKRAPNPLEVLARIDAALKNIDKLSREIDRYFSSPSPPASRGEESDLFKQALAEAQREIERRGGTITPQEREEIKERIKKKLGI
ncbi:MAG: hypothetical protein ACE5Z5_05730 [Candidatus Bathyarchaeia archaeon]